MARPHPALIDLAAGRPLPEFEDAASLLVSAVEHRMTGLLWHRIEAGEVTLPVDSRRELAAFNLRVRAHHQRLWRGLADITHEIGQLGGQVVAAKGVTAERRWYDRSGDRPSRDIDLLLRPDDLHKADDIVAAIQPNHRLLGHIASLAERGHLQSVDILLPIGIYVDLHFDLLKFEVRTRQLPLMWERSLTFELPDGGHVRVLDPETSLIHFLLHLNKDRFSRVLAFADIVHLIEREELDWDFIDQFLKTEGLDTHLYLSLETVYGTLGLTPPSHPRPARWKTAIWKRIWRPSVQLRGDAGRLRLHRLQYWIPLTARGHVLEALWRWLRRLFPTRELLDYYHPITSGPYFWRLAHGRVQAARMRRNEIHRAEDQNSELQGGA